MTNKKRASRTKRQVRVPLSKTKKRGRSTPASAKPNYADDDGLLERIVDDGAEVSYQDWDSGGPGAGAGRVSVYRYGRKFYVLHDAGIDGPFSSIVRAEKHGAIDEINSATVGIWHHDTGVTFERK